MPAESHGVSQPHAPCIYKVFVIDWCQRQHLLRLISALLLAIRVLSLESPRFQLPNPERCNHMAVQTHLTIDMVVASFVRWLHILRTG